MSITKIITLVVTGVATIALLIFSGQVIETLDAKEVMVIQSPIEGRLDVHVEPGMKMQWFGKVTKYPRQAQYDFCSDGKVRCSSAISDAKRLRFNDGGHALLNGAVLWEMPLDKKSIIEIHKKFGSAAGIAQQAVERMVDNAVYLSGPLMSSTESSGERRSELVQYINDQAENGVYVTKAVETNTKDPITGVEKTVLKTEIVRDDKGQPRRQQSSILAEYNIKLLPLSINELKYDNIVEKQIAERQQATTQVQIAQANARRAQQEALTVEEQGKATAAKAKWDQETIKAKEVTLAQQKLEVAVLAAKEAEQFKRQQILMGEGEGARKRLVLEADGALDPKLETYLAVNKMYAEAIAKYQGAWVPQVTMGQSSNQPGGQASALIDMLTVKTAKDLGLDMTIPKGAVTRK